MIAVLWGEDAIAAVLAALASTALLGINTYLKDHDLGELAQKHSDVATRLWDARERYLSLISDLHDRAISLDDARARRDELQEDLAAVYSNAPRTSAEAYHEAQKALQLKEELTFTDTEIDLLLPTGLRRSGDAGSG